MSERASGIRMAQDDLFFASIVLCMGVYFSAGNWQESDWWGFAGTVLLGLFGTLWLSARIYHLTHLDEVFGTEEEPKP